MPNWKQAAENAERYACYDPFSLIEDRRGHVNLIQEGEEQYYLAGSIDGVSFEAMSSEDGMLRLLQELNIDPEGDWYSL